jgi:hypothetical protein
MPPEPSFPNERRAHPRTLCLVDSRIAPYNSGDSLESLKFEKVRLKDLSVGGFSFWAAAWPNYAEVAFPLMDHGGVGVVVAEVREIERSEERFLVHCRFIRRLSESD